MQVEKQPDTSIGTMELGLGPLKDILIKIIIITVLGLAGI